MAAEAVFDQQDNGIVVLLDESPPEDLRDDVRQAAAVCPVLAIALHEK